MDSDTHSNPSPGVGPPDDGLAGLVAVTGTLAAQNRNGLPVTVRTARALFRGPLKETAAALVAGDISPAHARAVADGTRDLPDHVKLDAEPLLFEAATRLDPPQLRRAATYL